MDETARADVVMVGRPWSAITAVSQRASVEVRSVQAQELAERVDRATTLGVVAPTSAGVSVAQVVHAAAAGVPVLFVADGEEDCEEFTRTLAITPGIGRYSRCIVGDDPASVDTAVDEVERYRRRRAHRRTMDRVRNALGELAAGPPETLTRYLGQLFDHAPIGILVAESTGVVRAANPESEEVLGWPARHAVGSDFTTVFGGREARLCRDLIEDCVVAGEAAVETLTRTGPDGDTQHLEVTVAPVDPDRSESGLIVLLRDESVRIRAMEVAERARLDAEASAERYATLAWTLQESLLPPELPEIAGVELAARYHPAGDGSEIGGDFYDVFQVGQDEWFAVIGDVCGKGAGAARLTALTRYTLRAAAPRSTSVQRDLTELNAVLHGQYEQDRRRREQRFATASAIRFGPHDGHGMVVDAGSGGHAPPVLVRADGTIDVLACRGGLLGVFEDSRFVTDQARLGPDDVLVLYTDGVTEARRGDEQFGDERLHGLLAALAGSSADDIAAAIAKAALDFQDGPPRDDTAVLVVRALQSSSTNR